MTSATLSERVLTFHFSCTAPQMPPPLAWVDEAVRTHLPENSRVIQWAIVKSDSPSHTLWLEGSYSLLAATTDGVSS